MHDLEAAFGAPVLEAYGMTEAAHQMASNPLPPAARLPGSVGPGTDVRISIMDERGQHLPTGERGEVVIQGPNVVSGYDNNPEANATSFTDGWFRTGDQGFLDANGYLTLTGRLKEMINRGGEDLTARNRRGAACTRQSPKRVLRTRTVPGGEEVAAAVVVRETTTGVSAELLQRTMAEYKRPKRIHIVDAIPRTATGKIQRRIVAQTFAPQAS
jgi:acyl-CoA synthetase (AMP-forming)/AMP-acid ligase II